MIIKIKGIKIFLKLFFIIFVIYELSFVSYYATANPKSQSDSSDIDTYWGNKGYLYSNTGIPEKTPKIKPQPVPLPKTKAIIYKPRPTKLPSKKIKPKKITYEEPQEILIEEQISSPEEEITLLKEKLKKALNQLALANKKIQELQKRGLSSKTTQTYQVKKGDSLWKIAAKKETYGNPYKWLLLYHANRDQIYDPNLIYPYMVLTIPIFEEYERKTK